MSYNDVHDWIMALAETQGAVSISELMTYPVPIDRAHITAAAWDLVEDGWLTYSADAKFRQVQK